MALTKSFFFVHIPKTAGTSFRTAAKEALGSEYCHFDYGAGSPETSDIVQKYRYQLEDHFELEKALDRHDCRFLGGHMPAGRYSPLFPSIRILSFVRHPVDQMISHYRHLACHAGYKGTLRDFIKGPHGGGFQARQLSALPLEIYGFIGVTERYEDSLKVFNATYHTELGVAELNQNPEKALKERYEVPTELRLEFERIIQTDLRLFERANELLNERLDALDKKVSYVHGAVTHITHGHVSGYAFFSEQSKAVDVQIAVDGQIVYEGFATRDRPNLRGLNVPRNGYVGFEFRPAKPLDDGDRVVVRVLETGQLLGKGIVRPKHHAS